MHSRSDKHNQYLPRINGKILTSTRLCGRVEAGLLFITPQIIPHFSPLVNTFFKKIFPLFFTPPPAPALRSPRSPHHAPHASHSSLFPPLRSPHSPLLTLPTPHSSRPLRSPHSRSPRPRTPRTRPLALCFLYDKIFPKFTTTKSANFLPCIKIDEINSEKSANLIIYKFRTMMYN